MFRTLLVLASIFSSTASFAGTTVLQQHDLSVYEASNVTLNAVFAVNARQGRAWIEFSGKEYTSATEEFSRTALSNRVHVNGLAYNATNSTITLTLAGQAPLVCAHVTTGLFGGIRATDDCRLSTRMVTRRVDDSFEVTEVVSAQLLITIPDVARR